MFQFRFDYYKDGEILGSTFRNCDNYNEALECAKLRINDECDKVLVCFGGNFDGYFEVK